MVQEEDNKRFKKEVEKLEKKFMKVSIKNLLSSNSSKAPLS